jgi:hypothetical protein
VLVTLYWSPVVFGVRAIGCSFCLAPASPISFGYRHAK